MPFYAYYFKTSEPLQKVIGFYASKGNCSNLPQAENKNFEKCDGIAKPSGKYYVTIDMTTYEVYGATEYVVELSWRKHSDDIW